MTDTAAMSAQTLLQYYPSAAEVDNWCETVRKRAAGISGTGRKLEEPLYQYRLGVRHGLEANAYIAFEFAGRDPFYGYWQSVPGGPGAVVDPLARLRRGDECAPGVVTGIQRAACQSAWLLHPEGSDGASRDGNWPVLPDSMLSGGKAGYFEWLTDVLLAVRWAQAQPEVLSNRLVIFGTSQGGGTTLLTASILSRQRGGGGGGLAPSSPICRSKSSRRRPRVSMGSIPLEQVQRTNPAQFPTACRALGLIDTLSHAHRLTMPVLLTAGGADDVCPPPSIRSLFDRLPATRSYSEFSGLGHCYTVPFLRLATAWLGMYLA